MTLAAVAELSKRSRLCRAVFPECGRAVFRFPLNVTQVQIPAYRAPAIIAARRVMQVDIWGVSVQEMITQGKEVILGMNRDPQFGPLVTFGLGGIYVEALKDVTFRVAPLTREDALEMIDEIKTNKLLGEFRGSPAVDREALAKALVGVGELGLKYDSIAEIDINPLIISGDKPVAVDALVVLK